MSFSPIDRDHIVRYMLTSLRGVRVPGVSVKTPSTLQPHNNAIGFYGFDSKTNLEKPDNPKP